MIYLNKSLWRHNTSQNSEWKFSHADPWQFSFMNIIFILWVYKFNNQTGIRSILFILIQLDKDWTSEQNVLPLKHEIQFDCWTPRRNRHLHKSMKYNRTLLYQKLIVVTTDTSMRKHTAGQMLSSTFPSHPHTVTPFVSVFKKWSEKQGTARVRRKWTGCSFWLILSIIAKESTEIAGSTVVDSKIRRDHYNYLVWHFAQHRLSDFFEMIPS